MRKYVFVVEQCATHHISIEAVGIGEAGAKLRKYLQGDTRLGESGVVEDKPGETTSSIVHAYQSQKEERTYE